MARFPTLFALAAAALFAADRPSFAESFKTIYSVQSPGDAGYGPLLEDPAGTFYGVAYHGGVAGAGAIYKYADGAVSLFASLDGLDGAVPNGRLVKGPDGNFYGAAQNGGANNFGTFFKVTPAGKLSVFAKLSADYSQGAEPDGGLIFDRAGNFYGTTTTGGKFGVGTILKISPTGKITVLASLDPEKMANPMGGTTGGLVRDSRGNFYGVAYFGPNGSANSVIFKMTPTGEVTSVAAFDGTNEITPGGGLLLASDGNLYGLANDHMSGVVYKAALPDGGISKVAELNVNVGGIIVAAFYSGVGELIEPDPTHAPGVFYGATQYGLVFKVTSAGVATAVANLGAAGNLPYAGPIMGKDGALWLATAEGGASNQGAVVRVDIGKSSAACMASLGDRKGVDLSPGLVADPANPGVLYGAASGGGANDYGVVYKIAQFGADQPFAYSVVTALDVSKNVASPAGPMVLASDGNLYGTAYANFTGAVFKISLPGGQASAAAAIPGGPWVNGLTLAGDGSFYGIGTPNGNSTDPHSTVFRFTMPDQTAAYDFPAGLSNPVTPPAGALVQGFDGNLYGTCQAGGAMNDGAVFQVTPAGIFSTVASFTGDNGALPVGAMARGLGGVFYFGVTQQGGAFGHGAVFSVNASGMLSRVASFNGVNGAAPSSGLVRGPGWDFYGTTSAGGKYGLGTVFKVSPSGKITVIASMDGKTNGACPQSTMVLGSDGNLYGTTYSTIYQITPTRP